MQEICLHVWIGDLVTLHGYFGQCDLCVAELSELESINIDLCLHSLYIYQICENVYISMRLPFTP